MTYLEHIVSCVWELQRASEACPLGILDSVRHVPKFWDSPPIVLSIFWKIRDHADVILDTFLETGTAPLLPWSSASGLLLGPLSRLNLSPTEPPSGVLFTEPSCLLIFREVCISDCWISFFQTDF